MENELRIPTDQAVNDLIALNKQIEETATKVEALIKNMSEYGIALNKGVGSMKDLKLAESEIASLETEILAKRKQLIEQEAKASLEQKKLTQTHWDAVVANRETIRVLKEKAEAENKDVQARKRAAEAVAEAKAKQIELNKAHSEAIKINKELNAEFNKAHAEALKMNKAFDSAKKGTNEWGIALGSFQFKFNVLGNLIGNFVGNAIGNFLGGIKASVTEIVNQTVKLDSLRTTYKAIFENNSDYLESLRQLSIMAENNGTSIIKLKEQYISFAAASKGTAMQGQASFEVFNSITKSLTLLGKTGEQSDRVLLALTQMMSKGTVQAEELKTQMGDSLPGAINIMAKAVGTNVEGLMKMMKAGEVISSDVLPKFAKELEKAYGADTMERIDTLPAKIGRSETAFTNFVDSLRASGVIGWWYDLKTAIWETLSFGDSGITKEVEATLLSISKAQIDLNNLNLPLEQRKNIYAEMQNQYPAILANYELERDGLAKVNKALNEVTNAMIIKLGLTRDQADVDKKNKEYGESRVNAAKAEIDARSKLLEVETFIKKEGLDYTKIINTQRSLYGQLTDAEKYLTELQSKRGMFSEKASPLNLLYETSNALLFLSAHYKDSREKLEAYTKADERLKEVTKVALEGINGQAYAKLQENDATLKGLRAKELAITASSAELGKLEQLIDKNKKYKEVVQGLNEYKTKIDAANKKLVGGGQYDPMAQDVKSTNALVEATNKYIGTLKEQKEVLKGAGAELKLLAKQKDEVEKQVKAEIALQKEKYEQALFVAEKTNLFIDANEEKSLLKRLNGTRAYINEQRKLGKITEYEQLKSLNDVDAEEKRLLDNKLLYTNIEIEKLKEWEKIQKSIRSQLEKEQKQRDSDFMKEKSTEMARLELMVKKVGVEGTIASIIDGNREKTIKAIEAEKKLTEQQIKEAEANGKSTEVLEKHVIGLDKLTLSLKSATSISADFAQVTLQTYDALTSIVEAYYDRQDKLIEISEKRQVLSAKRKMKEQIAAGKSSTEAQAEYDQKLAKIQADIAYQKDMAAWKRAKRERNEAMVRINIANSEAVMKTAAEDGWYAAIGVAAMGTAALIVAGSQPLPDKPNKDDYYWKGTVDHRGGSAVVNDRGLGRELVIEPTGKAYIPQGENVRLPNLPKHSMVIPANITKELIQASSAGGSQVDMSRVESLLGNIAEKKSVTLGMDSKKLGLFVVETERMVKKINRLTGKR